MPTYRDWGERNPPGTLPQLLKTYIELFEHEARTKKTLRDNLPALLEQLTVSDIAQGVTYTVKVSLSDPEFRWTRPQENQSRTDNQGELELDGSKKASKQRTKEDGQGVDTQSSPEFTYEKLVPIEEIIDPLFNLIELPVEARKRIRGVRTRMRRAGVKRHGPRSRRDKRATHIEKMKREKKSGIRPLPYRSSDQRYRGIVERKDRRIVARVYLIRDKSGSMDKKKIALVNALLLLIYRFLRTKYREIEIVCILHDTTAGVVKAEEFFAVTSTGGTALSSGVERMHEEEKKHPHGGDIFVFQLSDGDNYMHDNDYFVALVEEALRRVLYFAFIQTKPSTPSGAQAVRAYTPPTLLDPNPKKRLQTLSHRYPNLHLADIHTYTDVRDAFLHLFQRDTAHRRTR